MAATETFYGLYVVIRVEHSTPPLKCLEHEATHVQRNVHTCGLKIPKRFLEEHLTRATLQGPRVREGNVVDVGVLVPDPVTL